jgi:hypothetical protein
MFFLLVSASAAGRIIVCVVCAMAVLMNHYCSLIAGGRGAGIIAAR